MTIIQDQGYDIKCDSVEDYKEALGDTGNGPCPGLEPGTRVLREDGNVYVVTGDMVCLKTLGGVYVMPSTLEVLADQKNAQFVAEMVLEEE